MNLGTLARMGALLLVLAPVSGCRLGEPDIWTQRSQELVRNRLLWLRQGASSYRFTQTKVCYCLAGWWGPAEITVRDGAIINVRPLQADSVPRQEWDSFGTVEDLFFQLDHAIPIKPYRYDVRYDRARGFPVFIDFDLWRNNEDDTLYVLVDSLTVLE